MSAHSDGQSTESTLQNGDLSSAPLLESLMSIHMPTESSAGHPFLSSLLSTPAQPPTSDLPLVSHVEHH